ncbi:MAG: heparan-alpha-glucosaminide N-acetyltransferase domain-containing protein [Planctomycetota bacterium]|jgi:uncharacterized membrane protein|nr:heparan-alpha-glucosaminide N-acetyltransferase domain-containing protein [Planctomycetota bacterium]MDP7254444.1 heparan-alpha-glucosaminide N-acetyltransferase domain-containing protein [Planctomycetota bacterium]
MPKAKQTTRNATADLLKGLAVLLMVQVHVMELFAFPSVSEGIAGRISLFLGGPPVAPVFLAVMGYFLLPASREFSFVRNRGIKLVLLGILLNVGLNLHLFIRIFRGQIQLSPWNYIFGVDILFAAGISLILAGLLSKIFRDQYWLWLAAAIAAVVAAPPLNSLLTVGGPARFLLAYFGGTYYWSYFPLFPWLAYPLLGISFRYLLANESFAGFVSRKAVLAIIWFVLLVFIGFTAKDAVTTAHSLPLYYHHGSLFFVWTALFMAFWLISCHALSARLGNAQPILWIRWVGKNVTAFYVVQWLIIGNIATAIFQREKLIHCILWSICVITVSSLIVRLWLWLREK